MCDRHKGRFWGLALVAKRNETIVRRNSRIAPSASRGSCDPGQELKREEVKGKEGEEKREKEREREGEKGGHAEKEEAQSRWEGKKE